MKITLANKLINKINFDFMLLVYINEKKKVKITLTNKLISKILTSYFCLHKWKEKQINDIRCFSILKFTLFHLPSDRCHNTLYGHKAHALIFECQLFWTIMFALLSCRMCKIDLKFNKQYFKLVFCILMNTF